MIRSWRPAPLRPASAERLAVEAGLHPALAQVLWQRGLRSPAEIARFLAPEEPCSRDIPGMDEAVTTLDDAVRAGEEIAVFGDYDADGVTATAFLVEAIRSAGGRVVHHIPHRFREGYGLRFEALAALRDRGVSLVVTVDNGISAGPEIGEALRNGLRVLVTDHHAPTAQLPAIPVLDPQLGGWPEGLGELAGVGVVYHLVRAWLGPEAARKGADLAMLGTVADAVSLRGENRRLVQEGLALLRSSPRPGLEALFGLMGILAADASEEEVAFGIAPRLNALGRMDDASEAVELLLTGDPVRAAELAGRVEELNRRRRALEEELYGRAESLLDEDPGTVIFVGGEGWHRGLLGLVAGRLSERHRRPAFVWSAEGEMVHGSARGPGEPSLVEVLGEAADSLLRFGGHAAAAGFSLERRMLPRLEEHLRGRFGPPVLDTPQAEASLHGAEVSESLFESVLRLSPFGTGNPPPLLEVTASGWSGRRFGDGRHLRLDLPEELGEAVLFRAPAGVEWELPGEIRLLGHPRLERYRGRTRRRWLVRGLASAEEDKLLPAETGLLRDFRGRLFGELPLLPGPLILFATDGLRRAAEAVRQDLHPPGSTVRPAGILFARRPWDREEFWRCRTAHPGAVIYLAYDPETEPEVLSEARRHLPDREDLLMVWRRRPAPVPEEVGASAFAVFREIGLIGRAGVGWRWVRPARTLDLFSSPTYRRLERRRRELEAYAAHWYGLTLAELEEWLKGEDGDGSQGEAADGS